MSKPLNATQLEALRSLGTVGREVFAPDSSMRSLVTRGLATRRFIGMRWWYIAPTPAGRAAIAKAEGASTDNGICSVCRRPQPHGYHAHAAE